MLRLFRISLLVGLLGAALVARPSPASAERWICPDCPDSVVERPEGATTLECPGCGKSYTQVDLAPPVAYINFRTRDAEVAWMCETAPEKCTMYRFDGIKAEDGKGGDVWVPWSAVYWFIPRQRILKLINGKELHTDYAMTPERCPEPSRFTFDTTDSLIIPGQAPSALPEHNKDVSLADLFYIAMSPEARDSARVRFIKEVEAGKHPRLPRTHARLYYPAPVQLTPQMVALKFKGETLYEIRVHENRGTVKMRLLKSCGKGDFDMVAQNAIRSSVFVPGGEMGVGVPSWTKAKVVFDGAGGAKVEEEDDPQGFWRP
jgi:hypothetical protein